LKQWSCHTVHTECQGKYTMSCISGNWQGYVFLAFQFKWKHMFYTQL
jgi:hypothetical protein